MSADPISREDLRLEVGHWTCGCGDPAEVCATLLALLEAHWMPGEPTDTSAWSALVDKVPDQGLRLVVLRMVDSRGLSEHGTTIYGAWLTERGVAVRDALRREQADGFEALLPEMGWCVHGHDVEGPQCPGCALIANGPRWRVGRSLGRTLYRDGKVIGMLDEPEVAEQIARALNEQEAKG